MASVLLVPCHPQLLKKHRLQWHGHTKAISNSVHSVIRNQKTCSFSFRSTDHVPLYELPGASFDHYMEDKRRVLQAVFPDKGTTQQLNEEVWRVKMPLIQCLFLNFQPTADISLKFKSNGEDYPPDIPRHVTKMLELQSIRWKLQGLNTNYMEHYHLSLDLRGALYPERRGTKSWLMNRMEMAISFLVSPTFALIPEIVLQNALDLVFRKMLDEMKHEFGGKLLADYSRFKRKKSMRNSV